MLKSQHMFLIFTIILLTACNNDEDQESEDAVAENEQSEEAVDDDDENAEAETEADHSGDEILSNAIAFYDDLDGLYVERRQLVGDQDDASSLEVEWMFNRNDTLYTRHETHQFENGDSEDLDNALSHYYFTDLDDPNSFIEYTTETGEGFTYPNRDNQDVYPAVSIYTHALENADVQYVSEEEVNGYEAYRIEVSDDEHTTHYWFDQETFFEVQSQYEYGSTTDEETDMQNVSEQRVVVDYEIEPEWDESLFQAPSDVDIQSPEE